MNKNVGVFLSAAFLVGIRAEDRAPRELTSKVEEATKRVLAAGEPARRVIVADCALEEQRLIAEGFALQSGFRVRHAPALGPSVSATLSTEVLAAAADDDGLRVFAVGDDPTAQTATLEALSALRRWTVLMSAGAVGRVDVADQVLGLALDPRTLIDTVNSVIADGFDPSDFAGIHMEAQRRFGAFTPKSYGFATMEWLVKRARQHARTQAKHAAGTTAAARAAAPTSAKKSASPANPSHSRATANPARARILSNRKDVRRAMLAQAPLSELDVATLSDVAIAHSVLTGLEAASFASFTRSTGVDVALFIDSARHLTSDAKWTPDGITTSELMLRTAEEHPGWVVGVPPQHAQAHLVSRSSLPDGWTAYVPRAIDDTAGVANPTPTDTRSGPADVHPAPAEVEPTTFGAELAVVDTSADEG